MTDFWGWVSVLAVLAVGLAGIPFLAGGGGRLRGGRRGAMRRRGGYRVRVGPGAPALLAAALLRRLDTVVLMSVTVAIGVLIALNARA